MILSRTLEYSSQLPVSVYGTGIHTLNASPLFLEAPSVFASAEASAQRPIPSGRNTLRHSVMALPA